MALTSEQIKRASEIAVKGFHIPAGFSEHTWYAEMTACNIAASQKLGEDRLTTELRKRLLRKSDKEARK